MPSELIVKEGQCIQIGGLPVCFVSMRGGTGRLVVASCSGDTKEGWLPWDDMERVRQAARKAAQRSGIEWDEQV